MADVTKKHFEREHSDFLRKVANEVYELVRNPETMTRFRERIRIFCEKNEENQREVEQLKKDSKADPKLQVSIKNLEKKTWGKTWDEMTDEERTQVDFEELLGTLPEGYENYVWDEGFCISPKTANLQIYLTPPTDWGREIDWRFWEYQATAASDDDKIISCYALLVAIHDTRISEKPIYTNKVYNGRWRLVSKWIKQLYQNCLNIRYPWEQDSFDGGEDVRDWITRALNDVKADLASLDKAKKMPEAKIEVGQNKSQPTKVAVARKGNADKEIWQMEEIAKSLVEWIGESQYEFKHEGEKFWQDYFERPYELNYDIFMQLQIMLLHVIDRSNFNRLIEWLKWYKSQIGKDLDEQRIKIRSECISVCESNLNLDNEKLNLRLIDSIHKIEGYTDELAKSLLNIARIMRQESQTDRTEIASIKQENEQTILQIIAQGEGDTVEFKETLEYDVDVRVNKNSKDVLLSSLKTIAGFLNTNGGTMLIGVNDSGKIIGIERDLSTMRHKNNDRLEQRIRNCLKDRFSPQPIGKVNISFEKFTEGTICRVDVLPNKEIIHLDDDLYVRDGNTTRKLEGRDLTDWIQERNN
jgi:predicted RNA-binding protein with RPS1 domain